MKLSLKFLRMFAISPLFGDQWPLAVTVLLRHPVISQNRLNLITNKRIDIIENTAKRSTISESNKRIP